MISKENKAKVVMVQGTASSAGKSILVTALCRILKQDGYRVAPFKSQNMSLNSFVTREGGEIGRAQVVQAEAAGIEPTVDMNPILLKPEADSKSPVIVMGKVMETLQARKYYEHKADLLNIVSGALNRLRSAYDVVVIEGAGSTAEINLKDREIVNMRIAKLANSPVLLIGDIDRGGIFASLIGTVDLLEPDERKLVKGLVINKFRGDISLFDSGVRFIEERSGVPCVGVIPYFRDIAIAQEDSVYLDERQEHGESRTLDIAVIRLPHLSNYDDFDPLEREGCRVHYITYPRQLGNPELIIIPGSKSTVADLNFLRDTGLADEITRLNNSGTPVMGICGGYQMLGRRLDDPHGVESSERSTQGLQLLDMVTVFNREKTTTQVKGTVSTNLGILSHAHGKEIEGYEIHMGESVENNEDSAFQILQRPGGKAGYSDGAISSKGTVLGTYIHGIFNKDGFRAGFLDSLREYHRMPVLESYNTEEKDREYDKLADLVRGNLDIPQIYRIIEAGIQE
ncbi:MAG: cobyric acid synthase [Dehalococcoidales bacterium]|nr:MAG: cobyric acid synthase [Dehalococcoidales bacterium]